MKTSELYKNKEDCCGCELCAQVCPQSLIQMKADELGFLYPIIEDDTNCINCKKCIKVCPSKNKGRENNEVKESYSFSLPDDDDVRKSASGGLATALGRFFISMGGVVYGVSYSSDCLNVCYERADTYEKIESFRGSKYVQASKGKLYSSLKKDIHLGKKILFIGLPCEVSAVYHALGVPPNLYTVSLICHGPTSLKVHQDYCLSLLHIFNSSLLSFSLRYKFSGWKPYYVHAVFDDGKEYLVPFKNTDYNTAFIYLKRPSCRSCKYKAENESFGLLSDLIIGDFHGVSTKSVIYNKWGVSQCSILTNKGYDLFKHLKDVYRVETIPYSTIKTTNRGMFMAIPQRGNFTKFVFDYNRYSLHYACTSFHVKKTNLLFELDFFITRLQNAFVKIIKKII